MQAIKIVFIAAILLGRVLLAAAESPKFRFGVHVDPVVSWFSVDTKRFRNEGAPMGMSAGVEFEAHFAPRYSFSTGIDYDIRGANLRHVASGYSLRTTYEGKKIVPANTLVLTRVGSLKVPLGIKMRAIEIGYWTFFANAGITAHFTLTQSATASSMGLDGESIHQMYYRLGAGYALRMGVEYSLGGASALVGGIGFNGGITPAYDAGVGYLRMNEVHLRLGFTF